MGGLEALGGVASFDLGVQDSYKGPVSASVLGISKGGVVSGAGGGVDEGGVGGVGS